MFQDTKKPAPKLRSNSGATWLGGAISYNDRALKVAHKSDLLPTGAFRCAICGLSGTGKTQFLLKLLPLMHDCLKYVIVCSRVRENSIHEAIGDWCAREGKHYFKAVDDSSAQEAIEIAVNAIADARSNTRSGNQEQMGLVIFDDFSSLRGRVNATNDGYVDTTVQCFNFLRNYAIASVIISQYSWSIPQRCMTSVNMIVCFRSSSKTSLTGIDLIVGLFFEDHPYKFMDCYRQYLMPKDCRYNFIVCNLERGEFHVVDFRNAPEGQQIDLLDSMDRLYQKSGRVALAPIDVHDDAAAGAMEATTGAGLTGAHANLAATQAKSLRGELEAGNDSPEVVIQRLMQLIKHNHIDSAAGTAAIVRVAKNNGLQRSNLDYLWMMTK